MGKVMTTFSSYAMYSLLLAVLLSGCSNTVGVSNSDKPETATTVAGKPGATGESGSVGVLDQGNQTSDIPPELAQAIEDIINE